MVVGVVGNESCDADSIIGAITLSHLMNRVSTGDVYVPYVQCSLDDLPDRLDVQAILAITGYHIASAGIRSVHDEMMDVEGWILVDHHFPSKIMADKPNHHISVVGIVDHHRVTSDAAAALIATLPPSSVDMRVIGSCCSMIGERYIKNLTAELSDPDKQMMHALLLVVVLDTHNMSPVRGTATPADVAVVDGLKRILNILDLDAAYTRMVDSKNSEEFWRKGSLDRILKYDFKEVESVGMSSVIRSIHDIDDQSIIHTVSGMGYSVFVIISRFHDHIEGGEKRQLAVYIADVSRVPALKEALLANFKIAGMDTHPTDERLMKFHVNDPKFSRKRFAPVFIEILKRVVY